MSEYHLKIRDLAGDVVGRADLEAETRQEALRLACSIVSPHGHDLWCGEHFLGRFDPTWGKHLDEDDFEATPL